MRAVATVTSLAHIKKINGTRDNELGIYLPQPC